MRSATSPDVRQVVQSLGFAGIDLVGTDIGTFVACAYAQRHPGEVRRLVGPCVWIVRPTDIRNVLIYISVLPNCRYDIGRVLVEGARLIEKLLTSA